VFVELVKTCATEGLLNEISGTPTKYIVDQEMDARLNNMLSNN